MLVGALSIAANTTDAEAVVSVPVSAAHEVQIETEDEVPEVEIVDWPITYDQERARLTSLYLDRHVEGFEPSGDVWKDARMEPRVIVLHHTAGPTAQGAHDTFKNAAARGKNLRDYQKLNTSTQFIVDRDGTIYRLFDETLVGRHAIGLNHNSIGVENVGGIDGYPLTDAQVEANIELIRYLHAEYPTISHVIGHHEYRQMESTDLFDERFPKYRTVKIDPGESFMRKVRAGIGDLALAGPPGLDDDKDAVASAD